MDEEGVPPSHSNVVGQTAVRNQNLHRTLSPGRHLLVVLQFPYFTPNLFLFFRRQLHIAALWGSGKYLSLAISCMTE